MKGADTVSPVLDYFHSYGFVFIEVAVSGTAAVTTVAVGVGVMKSRWRRGFTLGLRGARALTLLKGAALSRRLVALLLLLFTTAAFVN